jgi:hypothetical protein
MDPRFRGGFGFVMLPTLLARIGLPALIQTVGMGLEKISNPVARTAVDALKQVENALTTGMLSGDDLKEANRHIEKMTETDSDEFKTLIAQINESLRAEIASEDTYVRRMRPTFGYIIAATWAAQMLAVAFVILDNPEKAPVLLNAIGSLDTIWTVGLSVLGIYVYKRSGEKRR